MVCTSLRSCESSFSYEEISPMHVLFSHNAGEDVVFVANDWHTGLLPCYLKSMYQSRGIYMTAKVWPLN